VHALRNIHAVLVPGGLLVDTQPISPHPRVTADRDELGALDMREWVETIEEIDERVGEMIDAGFYELAEQRELEVTSTFDSGPDCQTIAHAWQGTQVPRPLADRLAMVQDPVAVTQRVRLRLFRAV
jgi:hypothetical protein